MNQPPLSPDALEAAADAVIDASFGQELPEASIDLATAAVSAYLAAALPDADELLLMTIKLPKNPEHDPRNKKTGACEVSQECTDLTGEHHTVAVRSQKQVEALRDQFGHITRVERVDIDRDDLTAALPEVAEREQLTALPDKIVLEDRRGTIWQKINGTWYTPGAKHDYSDQSVMLPARVLYRPEVKP